MNEQGKQLLELMFRPGESICISYNKFGYHSVPLNEVLSKDTIVLIPTEKSCEERGISWESGFEKRFTKEMNLVALNPIKGFREDNNCTAFRNFLVEIDEGSIKSQLDHIKQIGLPYSASIFSGNKSMHFLISLAEDLPDEKTWRKYAEWILDSISLADKLTKNPSRSIRIPGVWREPRKLQRLAEFKGPITEKELLDWLQKHPDTKPKEYQKRNPSETMDLGRVSPWVKSRLRNGLDRSKSRNQQWYAIAYEYALTGHSEDAIIALLGEHFTPERDFKEREWKMTIKSACKNARRK